MKEQLVYMGVDIAKFYLDAAIGNEKGRFSNDTIGHGELIKWLKRVKTPVQVICESSGGYERALVQGLARARVKISLVQANRVRQFARAAGTLAKTDRIDAELLCEFGKVMRPQTVTAAKLEQEHLRELESQRRHLTHLLVMEQNRAARVSDACVQKLNRSLINQIKKQIEQLDLLIKGHIDQSAHARIIKCHQQLSYRFLKNAFLARRMSGPTRIPRWLIQNRTRPLQPAPSFCSLRSAFYSISSKRKTLAEEVYLQNRGRGSTVHGRKRPQLTNLQFAVSNRRSGRYGNTSRIWPSRSFRCTLRQKSG